MTKPKAIQRHLSRLETRYTAIPYGRNSRRIYRRILTLRDKLLSVSPESYQGNRTDIDNSVASAMLMGGEW